MLKNLARLVGCWLVFCAGATLTTEFASAAGHQVRVVDAEGRPLADALVFSDAAAPVDLSHGGETTITQQDMEFSPRFLAIPVGTTVRFPNLDRTRHHVYSFSPAKVFELKLYRGEMADPVRFDEPGLVTLGCNVHDWMIGYVYVVATADFAVTGDDGIASVPGGAAGGAWQVWHPYLKPGDMAAANPAGTDGADVTELVVELRDNIALPQRPESTRTRLRSSSGDRRAR